MHAFSLGESFVICDATCTPGYAAAQIAKAIGCRVVGTTHRRKEFPLLEGKVDEIILDDKGSIAGAHAGSFEKVLS